jgi:chemotaxis protein methyltransferase CheR
MVGTNVSLDEALREQLEAAARVASGRLAITDPEFRQFREFIHLHTGIALSEHKRALVCSRLARRLRHYRFASYSQYYELLTQADPDDAELMEMINAITTNKTDFFRESHHFTFLVEQVFPAYRQGAARRLRLWSAAAATGEEAYSLAIAVNEAFSSSSAWDVRILATDIDTQVLAHAQNAIYTLDHAHAIGPTRLRRYFLKGAGTNEGLLQVKQELKDLVQFQQLNLIDDPWPMRGPFDVIFCRNVLIYFDKATQHRILERLAALLRKDGYLMLGHAESMHGFDRLFRPVGHSIYQARTGRPA